VTLNRFLILVLLCLFWCETAQARGEIVVQHSKSAEALGEAVEAELRALGMGVHSSVLRAALPEGTEIVVICSDDAAPVEIRVLSDPAREIVHVVSGASANESAIRVSETVRAYVVADSLVWDSGAGVSETVDEELEPSSWYDEQPSDQGDVGSDPRASSEGDTASATEPATHKAPAPLAPGPPAEPDERGELDEDKDGSFRTALSLGIGIFEWSLDIPPAVTLEAGLAQSFWGFLSIDLRAGIQADSAYLTNYVNPVEMNWIYAGGDVRFRVFSRGWFSADAGLGASAVRFEFTGSSSTAGIVGATVTEWTPWVRAGAVARIAAGDHVGFYLHGNVGSLLSELKVYGPGNDFNSGANFTDGESGEGTGEIVQPQDQGAWGPAASVGPAVVQIGFGMEATWDF